MDDCKGKCPIEHSGFHFTQVGPYQVSLSYQDNKHKFHTVSLNKLNQTSYSELKSWAQCMYHSALIAFQTLIWPRLHNQLTLKIINAL